MGEGQKNQKTKKMLYFRLLLTVGLLHLSRCDVDPRTGYYVPPATENDVFYPVDDEEPMGFPEIPPPLKQEWRSGEDEVVRPFGGTTFKYKYVTRGGRVSSTNPGNVVIIGSRAPEGSSNSRPDAGQYRRRRLE